MLWLILGFIGLALGAVGAVLPMLPLSRFYFWPLSASAKALKNCIGGLSAQSCIKTIWNPM